VPIHFDAVPGVEVEGRHGRCGEDHGEQRSRQRTGVTRHQEQEDESGGREDDGAPVNVRQMD
jgi:hypothetical protein